MDLTAVASQAKMLSDEARLELRQHKSRPVLAKSKPWLEEQVQLVLPRTEKTGAMQYVLNQWEALTATTNRVT